MIRFFDRWLKDVDNGADREPAVTWFHGEWSPPDPFADAWPGAWRSANAFPAPGTTERTWHLAAGSGDAGRLLDQPDADSGADAMVHRATAGARTGAMSWRAGHPPNGIAGDARAEEALGPVYVSEPLEAPLDILGFGEVVLHWESPVAVATAVVRLSDQAPDGTPRQVAIGALNLTHRDSHTEPEPLVPGTITEVRIPLRPAGHRFRAGHRLRLSVATSCWPALWPSPEPARHRLHRGASHERRGRSSRIASPGR
jgi:putative CocE/NonD family hydrolase